MNINIWKEFRQQVYACMERRADYKQYLGMTESLTIANLECTAASANSSDHLCERVNLLTAKGATKYGLSSAKKSLLASGKQLAVPFPECSHFR